LQAGGQRFESAYLHHLEDRRGGRGQLERNVREGTEVGALRRGLRSLKTESSGICEMLWDAEQVICAFYGQATKGVRWMPWRWEAMKGVVSCDKPRLAAACFDPGMPEWGNPMGVMSHHPLLNS
jgi:hypothetical protein